MAWVVDTSVLLDVRIGYPLDRATVSAECLEAHFTKGLTVCPVTFVELAPAFHGDLISQRKWLESLGISCREPWIEEDTEVAHTLWNGLIQRKRQGQTPKRPVADVLIAAFARRFDGLITGNQSDFSSIDPNLRLVVP